MQLAVHWPEVWKLVEEPPVTLASFTLDDLLAARIENHIERVSEIAAQASGEADILKNIEEIRVAWETTNFTIKNYRDTKDRFYITEIEDLTTLLEDHQMRVQGCMGSRHVARIRADVEAWERKLGTVSDVIDEWLVFQKSWMYLENIFNAEDIIK
jgi:dynein heavy chain